MTLSGILKRKGSEVVTVGRTATLAEVAVALAERTIGLVVVLGASGALEGVISERDLIRKLAEHGPSALTMSVEQAMTRGVVTATPNTTMDQAMGLMTAGGFRHLPVMESGKLAGIISIRDVVRAQFDINQFEVATMRAYLANEYVAARSTPEWARA